MKRKDWTGGLFFIYLAFVIWVILLKFSTSPDALPHLRNINLIPYGDCLMINGNLNIRELAEKVVALTGSRSIISCEPLPGDDPKQRRPDISLARKMLGWEPVVPLEEGLKKTIAYFEDQLRQGLA